MEASFIVALLIYAFLGVGVALAFYQFYDSINKSVILAGLLIGFLIWQDLASDFSLVDYLTDVENSTYIHILVMGLLSLFFMMSILNPKNKTFKYYYKITVFSLVLTSLLCHASIAIGFDIGQIVMSK
jgi:hypothetical protein